jgi:trk system potassium uptake protein TrkA
MDMKRLAADGRTGPEETCTYHVLAGDHLGSAVARRLRADGHSVSLVEDAWAADGEGPTETVDVGRLEAAGVGEASTVVVATGSDSRNLLVAQLVRTQFDVSDIVVLAHQSERVALFEDAGHDPVCATDALSKALVENA